MTLAILETRSVSASNVAEFERTGMFSSYLSLNIRHKVTFPRYLYLHYVYKFLSYLGGIDSIAPCSPDHILVRAKLLPADPEAFSIGREAMYSPNLPGLAVFSDTQCDVFLIPAPARPEGCPIHLWFPFLDARIGELKFDMHPLLTYLSDAYALQRGTHMTITEDGTFPGHPFNTPYATGAAMSQDDSLVEFIAFTAKRLWLFRPNQRDLVRVAPPLDKQSIMQTLGLPYRYGSID